MENIRPLSAEFIGTFGLVFASAGVIVTDAAYPGNVGLLGIALAPAMVLSVMVTALMRVSGAHFNPAVTLALWMANKVSARTAGLYVITQLLAAVAAAFLIQALFPQAATQAVSVGVPQISGELDLIGAIVIEAVLTFFLVSAVFGTAISPDAPAVGGFGIGVVLLFTIVVGGPMTGAALNPARAFGPALVAGVWTGHAAYWIGPLLGGAVAALIWDRVLLPRPT
jgi:MIP family channel proteins